MMPPAEAWVAVGFVCFLGLLAYLGVHGKLIGALDRRQARIKQELDEAKKLREEAQTLLADFERKGRAAESEAAAIIASAKTEAERLATEAKSRMEDFVARRTKMAEAKIAQAEAQALADVRSAAADAAVAAAEKILSAAAKGKVAEDLLAQGIEDVRKNSIDAVRTRRTPP
jgi:F-type H+-transporting ATPase subunit b